MPPPLLVEVEYVRQLSIVLSTMSAPAFSREIPPPGPEAVFDRIRFPSITGEPPAKRHAPPFWLAWFPWRRLRATTGSPETTQIPPPSRVALFKRIALSAIVGEAEAQSIPPP
jgi:hypothetical protein